MTDAMITAAYGTQAPPWLAAGPVPWTAVYPAQFRTLLAPLGGYVKRPEGYFVEENRRQYDFHLAGGKSRGLAVALRPSLGIAVERDTTLAYDTFDCLPVTVTDPVGLQHTAEYNYRVLQPAKVTDANGNPTRFIFSPLGLVSAVFKTGADSEGDHSQPSVSYNFDFRAFELRGQPAFVHSTTRLHHESESDVPLPARDELIEMRVYSDGFGRILQTRKQERTYSSATRILGTT